MTVLGREGGGDVFLNTSPARGLLVAGGCKAEAKGSVVCEETPFCWVRDPVSWMPEKRLRPEPDWSVEVPAGSVRRAFLNLQAVLGCKTCSREGPVHTTYTLPSSSDWDAFSNSPACTEEGTT